jgi:hypothetical protein
MNPRNDEDRSTRRGGEEEEEEDLFVFNDTIEGSRAPKVSSDQVPLYASKREQQTEHV